MPGTRHTIRLELARPLDMFETPSMTLGAQLGGSIPGVTRCLAQLTARDVFAPVHLELVVPEAEAIPGLEADLRTTLGRYCDEHRRQNELLVRSTRRGGLRALLIGAPVTLLGLVIVGVGSSIGADDPIHDVVDIIGWVLAWLGLWYPFDKVLFYPLDLTRENRALKALRSASITVVTASGPISPEDP